MRSVFHLDLAYFLKEILGYTVYDALWIDAEGAEYGLFPYFYRGGKLDQYGITICQFNMEHLHVTTDPVPDQIHSPNEEKKELFKNFIFKLLEDNRYAFFRPVQTKHLRLYFLNFSDKQCVNKYLFKTVN
ncbi:unnamed protein product [Cylicocyclus nassatus]|uniref:Methyltransferase FkbM domain-containing protein n=1 Tax=Cylicocyclus nassatus TaxID=53992 RepID=A0AA36H8R8_CYLNA|nr:unnamed protein product [Cylicocyclus nassatus]CAJ0606250.1 unnamed protein product [Cylicocyclus nassatus]